MYARAVILVLVPMLLFAAPSPAAPMGCLTDREAQAEQAVRHGVRLREGAWRCEALGFTTDTIAAWQAADAVLGQRFAAQTELRRRAFVREFEKRSETELARWNGRILGHFRHRPLGEAYCQRLAGQLQEAARGGWRAFQAQAGRERPEVAMDHKLCR